jgi:hypothetical protein
MTNSEYFKQHHYTSIPGLVPEEICNVATKYALLKMETEFHPETTGQQVPGTHSIYSDTLMETLMYFMLPHMEKHTGLELCPTYSYYRVYKSGDDLFRHKDRPSCEISTTVCLGFKYNHKDPDYRWGIYVDELSFNTPMPDGKFVSSNNPGVRIDMNPGDVVIYRGCDVEHWRDIFDAEEGSYHVQAFLHYIDKNGPNYPEYAYDKRKGIGHKQSKGANN